MARIVIMGAGVAGHTAALHLRRMLKKPHEVIVVAPNSKWNWIPSNIWVGVGKMSDKQVTFPLAPIYQRKGIEFHQALANEVHPQGNDSHAKPFIRISYTDPNKSGQVADLEYDYLINATGPKLNFNATPGLGPDGNSWSVCTAGHAIEAAKALGESINKMKQGQKQTLLIGMGHGTCTCQGAAFEYLFNVEHQLTENGVRDKAELVYVTNETELGDFGVGGMVFQFGGGDLPSQSMGEMVFRERNIKALMGVHVERVDPDKIVFEKLDGSKDEQPFDFAMLLPPFRGVELKAFDRSGNDITEELFLPSGFMRVDADYTAKPFSEWKASDWPKTYQVPGYPNIMAAGIAFAPPHQMSEPKKTPNGTMIAPAPPRTGMPAGIIAKACAMNIKDMIEKGGTEAHHTASMADMGAACVASTGYGMTNGSAITMTMYPIVPDFEKYPETGRHKKDTSGEIGLAGHWMKAMLHFLFIYKAKAKPFWYLIPE
jgi:sulfide:quinone oxidoreductase